MESSGWRSARFGEVMLPCFSHKTGTWDVDDAAFIRNMKPQWTGNANCRSSIFMFSFKHATESTLLRTVSQNNDDIYVRQHFFSSISSLLEMCNSMLPFILLLIVIFLKKCLAALSPERSVDGYGAVSTNAKTGNPCWVRCRLSLSPGPDCPAWRRNPPSPSPGDGYDSRRLPAPAQSSAAWSPACAASSSLAPSLVLNAPPGHTVLCWTLPIWRGAAQDRQRSGVIVRDDVSILYLYL